MIKKTLIAFRIISMVVVAAGIITGIAMAENRGAQSVGKQVTAEKSININTADIKQLSSLDGIGKKKAEAIIAYRTEHGQFRNVDDLRKVKGIGKKIHEKIKELVVLQ